MDRKLQFEYFEIWTPRVQWPNAVSVVGLYQRSRIIIQQLFFCDITSGLYWPLCAVTIWSDRHICYICLYYNNVPITIYLYLCSYYVIILSRFKWNGNKIPLFNTAPPECNLKRKRTVMKNTMPKLVVYYVAALWPFHYLLLFYSEACSTTNVSTQVYIRPKCTEELSTDTTRNGDPMLVWCWSSSATLAQH